MTIPLPPLPEHLHHPELKLLDAFTREQVRAIQREAMRVALEAAARECEARQTPGTGSVAILNGAADAIRNLEIGT